MMKHYSLYILISLLGLAFLNSCTDEDMAGKKEQVIEGVPVGLTMSVTPVEGQKVTTRVAIDEKDENAVFNVWIFIFDYSSKQIEFIKEYTMSAATTSATVDVPVGEIVSGEKYIYAIANTDGELTSLNREFTKEAIPDVESLMEITSSLGQEDVQRLGGHLLMGGAYDDEGNDKGEGYCNIQPPVSGNVVNLTGSIKLLHVDSRIRFDVSTAKGISFIPKSWKVINVPKTTNVIGQTTDASTDYFDYSAKSFDTNKLEGTEYKGGAFTFYMFENRKDAKNPPMEMTYEDRERQEKLDKGSRDDHKDSYNGEYLYADKYATYVEMTGTYTGNWYDEKEKITKNISAEVKYTVHLGYVDGLDDFKSKRNLSYTYKIQIAGVDNIIAEVEASQISGKDAEEKQPGAEGNVVIATQNLYLDSHYETRTVRFNKSSLANLTVKVETPYASGSFSISGDGSATNENFSDFSWVKFVRNDKVNGIYGLDYQVYPGDGFGNQGDDPNAYNEAKQFNGYIYVKKYLTIDQLLRNLYLHKDDLSNDFWDKNGDVIYTVFVDEYYYQNKNSYDDWKTYVNGSSRKMHILCNTQYSYDNESSVTKSSILINQRPIQTIYNTGNSALNTAWGIETKDETPGFGYKGDEYDEVTKTNGRYMTFRRMKEISWGSTDWSDYIKQEDNTLSNKDAAYTCLQRNRDLDGDGKIDSDEIRWYLPATNQYTGLWIGKDALNPEARLFQEDPMSFTESDNNHYVSSNGVRFWAEEGASTGSNTSPYPLTTTPFKTRCARNLGGYYRGTPKQNEEPIDYASPTLKFGIVTSIDLTNLNPNARRRFKQDVLLDNGEHNGADLNRPYAKFEVSDNSYNGDCPEGWRIPNQRELCLFVGYSTSNISSTPIKSCTYSNLGYKNKAYFTAFYNGSSNVITLGNPASAWRCVKDVD